MGEYWSLPDEPAEELPQIVGPGRLLDVALDEAQGFLLGRPVAFDRFVEWAESWEARSDAPAVDAASDSLRRRATDG